MERNFQSGDKVRIRQDAISDVGSQLASSYWGPNRSILTVRQKAGSASGCFVVRGPFQSGPEWVDQTIFGDFLEFAESTERKVGKPCKLSELKRGGKFMGMNGHLMMKTDERDPCNCVKSVIIEGSLAGVIGYIHAFAEVTPILDDESESSPQKQAKPNPWEQAKVDYGDLEPGDLFRTARGEGPGRVCVVTNKTNIAGNYFLMVAHGSLEDGFSESDVVYRDDILIEYGI